MKYQVIDNFLSADTFRNIQNTVTSNRFPWYFIDEVAFDGDPDSSYSSFLFTSTLYENNSAISNDINIFSPVFEKLGALSIHRVRVNCHTYSNVFHKYSYHIDVNHPSILTAIFYLNSNNGLTYLQDVEINSLENRMLVFNSSVQHCGTNTTNSKGRFLVNINFIPDINSNFYSLL